MGKVPLSNASLPSDERHSAGWAHTTASFTFRDFVNVEQLSRIGVKPKWNEAKVDGRSSKQDDAAHERPRSGEAVRRAKRATSMGMLYDVVPASMIKCRHQQRVCRAEVLQLTVERIRPLDAMKQVVSEP